MWRIFLKLTSSLFQVLSKAKRGGEGVHEAHARTSRRVLAKREQEEHRGGVHTHQELQVITQFNYIK